ncbi:phosphatidate cytidylyltransferase [Alienimonas californiensis]|uniref:Phosphatidate cytidylyltransferase n=1 Tax=Alienimonas californiensis TaxID=2527989 RepID=A0A517P8E8_9PLAN|nr:phosphatidate cytidylyltransferase [Alienimonas californiensis]QDT15643.1 Phosphatidate cytidylyltransferase [Alienimonas californiensis]
MPGRLLSAAILIPGFLGLCWLDHRSGPTAPALFVALLAIGWTATAELVRLFPPPAAPPAPEPGDEEDTPADYWADPKAARPSLLAAGLGVTFALLGAWAPHWFVHADDPTLPATLSPTNALTGLGGVTIGVAAGLILAAVRRVLRFDRPGGHAEGLAAEAFGLLYVGGLLAVTAQLRWVGGPDGDGSAGYLAIGSLIAAAKCGDTGAYFTGRLLGKRKLIPRVSPGKTWAGAVGALFWAAVGTTLWLWLAGESFGRGELDFLRAAVFGAAVGLAGLFGDLVESVLKRDAGVKDAGALLPGMGGVLDVLDSLLLAGPVAVLLWSLWPPA